MYSGDWLGGLPHGNGKYLCGDYYEGQFCNGMKYGGGEETFKNGDRYIGEYINGLADGYGEYFWADGSVYKGDFKHGVRHGYGIWTDHNETENYSGCYRMDKK
jgi:hypothetical protein